MSVELTDLNLPSLVTSRWKYCKTQIFQLASGYDKFELIRELLKQREVHTVSPNLSTITAFAGIDNAIHSIMRWEWEVTKDTSTLEQDALEIGIFGAELMILHTLKEAIRNELLEWDGKKIVETEYGRIHFENLNSFNVEITGSKIDIARKRFLQSKQHDKRKSDPTYKLTSVKNLYYENSIIMLLRTPLTFYRSMSLLSDEQHRQLIDFHEKLIAKSNITNEGVVKIRLKKGSNADKLMSVLTPPTNKEDRRPSFTACIRSNTSSHPDTVDYYVGIGSLSMFAMFVSGFNRDKLDEKSHKAELAVQEIIESTGYWKILESNTEVIQEKGEVVTEIDIIAHPIGHEKNLVTFEVKDFSFWKGWIWNQSRMIRQEYYKKAVAKLPMKEEYIREKYNCDKLDSYIVTSIPEHEKDINGTELIYLADLPEMLMKYLDRKAVPRTTYYGSNFLIRYFERLQMDYYNASKLSIPVNTRLKDNDRLRMRLAAFKEDYEKLRAIYKNLHSEQETAKVSSKLAAKRLIKDDGSKHYHLEDEYQSAKARVDRLAGEIKIKARALNDIKERYEEALETMKNNEREIERLNLSRSRLLAARIF